MNLQQIEAVLDKMYEAGELGDSTRNTIMSRLMAQELEVNYKPSADWVREHPEWVQEEDDKRTGDATC